MRTVFELKNGFEYAMHGNGAYKGLRQTNTLDAMQYWHRKGVRIFEIDMARTADERYVAVAHYMNCKDLGRLELFDLPEKCTQKWFMNQKLFSISTKGLLPLSLEGIIEELQTHEDIIVMLDLFGMFTEEEAKQFTQAVATCIGGRNDLWERILLESYNKKMADGIQSISEEANVIACVRYEENEHDESTVMPKELLDRNIQFISYPWYCVKEHQDELENFVRNGITVFSRTKDNTNTADLRNIGVNVNIIAQRYDGWKIIYQYPLYMMTYIKRIVVKMYLRISRY